MPLLLAALFLGQCCTISVSVRTAENQPIAGAAVTVGEFQAAADSNGHAALAVPQPGVYMVSASAPGFQTIRKEVEINASLEVELLLPPAFIERVLVEAQVSDGSAATVAPVSAETLKRLPTDPPTVREALPLIPGVVRTPEGRLSISGSPEYRSTLLVNSLDVTDPATGKFGATAPIDAVESLNVFRSPFLAEYGRFTAAVVVVDTKRGGDKWHAELNDPTPELRIRSRHLSGVRGFTPRLSFSGPVVKGKLYVSQSGEYRLNKTPVFMQPFPLNETWREGWNSLTQFDYIPSAAHSLTATVHLVPFKTKFANLSFYTPRSASANFKEREFHAGITDRLAIGGGVLETALSASETTASTRAQGEEEMTLLPAATVGNYFARQDRRGRRYQWLESYAGSAGAHSWKVGGALFRSELGGWFAARPVNVAGPGGVTLSRIEYRNQPGYAVNDWETGAFAQDHWQVWPNLAVDFGMRGDWQRIAGTFRAAPRIGFAWAPLGDASTVVRGGFGWFFDRAPLSVYAFRAYPWPVEDGEPLSVGLGTGGDDGALVFGGRRAGGFAPRSRNAGAQIEHRFAPGVRLRAGYLESDSDGLIVLKRGVSRLSMEPAGRSKYRQFELVSRLSYREGQEIFASYVRSFSRGNVNDFASWAGDFPAAIVRPDAYATGNADTPHRFLLWGVIPIDPLTRVAPVVEYRSGLPYSPLNARQQYAGEPNSRRFPDFLSLDFRIARDIHVKKHAVQLSFSMFNITNHWNPDAVRLNTGDPQFGEFLGQHRRRYRLDFDFLF